ALPRLLSYLAGPLRAQRLDSLERISGRPGLSTAASPRRARPGPGEPRFVGQPGRPPKRRGGAAIPRRRGELRAVCKWRRPVKAGLVRLPARERPEVGGPAAPGR